MFPAYEALLTDIEKTIFIRQFGIPLKISGIKWFTQRVTNDNMLRI